MSALRNYVLSYAKGNSQLCTTWVFLVVYLVNILRLMWLNAGKKWSPKYCLLFETCRYYHLPEIFITSCLFVVVTWACSPSNHFMPTDSCKLYTLWKIGIRIITLKYLTFSNLCVSKHLNVVLLCRSCLIIRWLFSRQIFAVLLT